MVGFICRQYHARHRWLYDMHVPWFSVATLTQEPFAVRQVPTLATSWTSSLCTLNGSSQGLPWHKKHCSAVEAVTTVEVGSQIKIVRTAPIHWNTLVYLPHTSPVSLVRKQSDARMTSTCPSNLTFIRNRFKKLFQRFLERQKFNRWYN